ncbi:unnamed protein product [Brachionus calyciflorus]|uniref:Uncharacterized protein n=1 Tax=Brachionus calyciflorus TaxID=104777 RepID=A0A814B2U1_9BILA|nr:unnamed protein product [Brachionus calyciflorus]
MNVSNNMSFESYLGESLSSTDATGYQTQIDFFNLDDPIDLNEFQNAELEVININKKFENIRLSLPTTSEKRKRNDDEDWDLEMLPKNIIKDKIKVILEDFFLKRKLDNVKTPVELFNLPFGDKIIFKLEQVKSSSDNVESNKGGIVVRNMRYAVKTSEKTDCLKDTNKLENDTQTSLHFEYQVFTRTQKYAKHFVTLDFLIECKSFFKLSPNVCKIIDQLMIFYLQRVSPRILPCLDTVNVEISKYQNYFRDKLTFSQYVNKFYVNNKDTKTNCMTENELWIGFLDYYTRIFDFNEYKVDLRTKKQSK